jgi:uncharacterized protein (TIGR03437 family)
VNLTKTHLTAILQAMFSLAGFVVSVTTISGATWAQNAGPVIRYANILGGSGSDKSSAVAVGPGGYLYITGRTASADFPNAKRLSASHDATNGDLFVVKVDPSGANLVYSVIVGAGQPVAIAVDSSGSAYIAGTDTADDFPTTKDAITTTGRCFLSKIDAAGAGLVWSTKLPCKAYTSMYPGGLTVDAAGNSYLTGYSGAISTTPGAFNTTGFGPYAMKVNAQGSAMLYSTYLPGTANYASAQPHAIAVDTAGNAYITGSADARGFPTTVNTLPSEQPQEGGTTTEDVFVLKLNADGSQVLFSTLFGGYGADVGLAIAPQADGYIYVAGSSRTSTGFGPVTPFPTTSGALDTAPGFPRGFLSKLSPGGDALAFSTFLPGTLEADCISVTDAGVDVLAFQKDPVAFPDLYLSPLLRVKGDGSALLSSSTVSAMGAPRCGQSGGTFGLVADMSGLAQVVTVSPNLTPIGPVQKTGVWFSAVSVDVPGAQRLNLDAGELLLRGWPAPDGSLQPVARSIHATSGGQTVPLGVFGGSYVNVAPRTTTTPGEIVVKAPQGYYTDRLTLFAPGVQNGLAIVSVSMSWTNVEFSVRPLDSGGITLSATGPDAPPISTTLALTSTVADALEGNTPARLNFTVAAPGGPLPSWLTVDPMSGTSPTQIRITCNPAGLAPGSYYQMLQLNGPSEARGWPGGTIAFNIPVLFLVAQTVSTTPYAPYLIVDPSTPTFHLSVDRPTESATVHLTSSGNPIAFTVGPKPAWMTIQPSSGTTPVDLTVTVSPSPLSTGDDSEQIALNRSDGTALGYLQVLVHEVLPDYVGYLAPYHIGQNTHFAPGGLFYLNLDPILGAGDAAAADPGALAFSMAGYSFKLNGIPVPLRSYTDHMFVAQVPWKLVPATYTLDGFDASGHRIATGQMALDAVAPASINGTAMAYLAKKADGSTVNAANPARPGEAILVTITGQGAVTPALADGSAAPAAVASSPTLPMVATIAGLPANIRSATMSVTEAGVLDVWLDVPNVADGYYDVSISVADANADIIGMNIRAGAPVALISVGGIVNSASLVGQIAPGSLFSIFGSGLASSTLSNPGSTLPDRIGQTSVTIGGKTAGLLYVSPTQINAQAPYELASDPASGVMVTVNGVSSVAASVTVTSAAPGIFEYGDNRAVVQNDDFSLNSESNGAAAGSYIVAYLTGSGPLDNPVQNGAPAPSMPLSRPLGAVTASLNGVPAEVAFAGLTPGFVGLMQVNAKVPSLPPGTYPLVVSIAGQWSNSALMTVK